MTFIKPPTGVVISPKELVIEQINYGDFVQMCGRVAEKDKDAA
jgi:hypothetical protein